MGLNALHKKVGKYRKVKTKEKTARGGGCFIAQMGRKCEEKFLRTSDQWQEGLGNRCKRDIGFGKNLKAGKDKHTYLIQNATLGGSFCQRRASTERGAKPAL